MGASGSRQDIVLPSFSWIGEHECQEGDGG